MDEERFDPGAALTAGCAICIQMTRDPSGSVAILHEKHPDRPAPPASVVKLLTALTALDIAERTQLSPATLLTVEDGDDADGSGRNLQPGDRLSFQDALANLLLASSNSCANAIARSFGTILLQAVPAAELSPVDRFVDEMNRVAAGLGMTASRFCNPHGLAVRGQRSTARDLARLLIACRGRRPITRIWRKRRYVVSIEGPNPRLLPIRAIFRSGTARACPGAEIPQFRGGKSGSLWPSHFNLAAISERADGELLVTVTLGSPSVADRYRDYRWLVDLGNAAPSLDALARLVDLAKGGTGRNANAPAPPHAHAL